jgi:hypothetical protein
MLDKVNRVSIALACAVGWVLLATTGCGGGVDESLVAPIVTTPIEFEGDPLSDQLSASIRADAQIGDFRAIAQAAADNPTLAPQIASVATQANPGMAATFAAAVTFAVPALASRSPPPSASSFRPWPPLSPRRWRRFFQRKLARLPRRFRLPHRPSLVS